jgi:release factor glutamine methyltransferase
MTVRDAVRSATRRLRTADSGVETPHLDAILLVGYCLGVDKETLFREPERELPERVARALEEAVSRRAAGTPISYIRRRKEFYGREFYVDERVLVPRPETETLIEAALALIDGELDAETCLVHDCCTGSGCIAITLKAERPTLRVSAADISQDAVDVARHNAARLLPDVDIDIDRAELLEAAALAPEAPSLITANPPYIPEPEYRRMEANGWPEPPEALAAGEDGLEVLRRLVPAAFDTLRPNGYFLCEIGYDQGESALSLAREAGFASVWTIEDLGGRDRVLAARRADENK